MRFLGVFLMCSLCAAIAYTLGKSHSFEANSPTDSARAVGSSSESIQGRDSLALDKTAVPDSTASLNDEPLDSVPHDCFDAEEVNNQVEMLVSQFNKTKRELNDTQNALRHARTVLNDAGLELPQTITREDIESVLPAPFTDIIANADFSIRETYKEFLNEDRNVEWAIDMETNIRDFFALHEHAIHVELESVICKTRYCEIRGFEKAVEVFPAIMRAMSVQPWYTAGDGSFSNFTPFTPSMHNDDNPAYFYHFAMF